MTVYISGPVTGRKDAVENFRRAENYLIREGYEVINPVRICSSMPPDTRWEEFIEVTLAALKRADAVYMLEGWEMSHGAMMEYHYAKGKKLAISYEY